MASARDSLAPGTGQTGRFNYLESAVEHSLYRNGKVLTRRDPNGSDSVRVGVDLEAVQTQVMNARLEEQHGHCSLHANGFELLDSPLDSSNPVDFHSHDSVVHTYYAECARIVQEASGASTVCAFDHNVRSAGGKKQGQRIDGGQEVQGPAHLVHGDYTLTSAPQRLRDLSQQPGGNDTFRSLLAEGEPLLSPSDVDRVIDGGRFAIINVWRNIADEPVATHPLALCDGQSVEPEDLVVFEIHYEDRVGENYFAKQAASHRWFYYPSMTRDEALLIKQWDSNGALATSSGQVADSSDPSRPCTFSFHSAFEDPGTPADAPDRWSIEVRCIALYD